MKFKGVLHPLMVSPSRVVQLFEVSQTSDGRWPPTQAPEPPSAAEAAGCSVGVWVGAGCNLSELQSLLTRLVLQLPDEKTELFRALIQQLKNLGSQQIRNVAVSGARIQNQLWL